ncbi:hypothetical protein IE53DRAFT_345762 [Violaceomyces palustris]|uniref:Uncharacterized protein n=1 Tax=Violaceomyces palustris TaxID=1673888 RepID=A0ACD0NUK9_9BASI|nr:hypothetical protein IE53DRAFT_345762 [Violaceomyces palustris]
MPHKRAKFSQRQADRFSKGNDLPPTATTSKDDLHFRSMPKGAMRIIMAGKIQEEYNRKKRAMANGTWKGNGKEGGGEAGKNKPEEEQLKIRPGEKLKDFNQRVEQTFAPSIHSALRHEARASGNAKKRARRAQREKGGEGSEGEEDGEGEEERKARADKAAAKQAAEPTSAELKAQRMAIQSGKEVKEFAKASQVRRINDVAQAPPTLTKAPRGETVQSKLRKADLSAKIRGEDVEEARRDVMRIEKARFKGRLPTTVSNGKRKAMDSEDREDVLRGKTRRRKEDQDQPPLLSMARKKILEEERNKVVQAYRSLKESKIQDAQMERKKRGVAKDQEGERRRRSEVKQVLAEMRS